MLKKGKKVSKKVRKFVKILGIKLLVTQPVRVIVSVKDFVSHNRKFYIVTPNPELLIMAQKNKQLKEALNQADLPIPDGVGLAQAAKYLSLSAPKNKILRIFVSFYQGILVGAATIFNKSWLMEDLNILKGREVFLDLINLAQEKKWKVFLFGGLKNEAAVAALSLKKSNPRLQVKYIEGPVLDDSATPTTSTGMTLLVEAVQKINDFKPHILFVALRNPKQEIWIRKNLSRLNVGGAMAVGGTFRYIAGMSKLPPRWMEETGLEWIWRLVTEPHRILRVFRAFPIFPMKVFLYKITHSGN